MSYPHIAAVCMFERVVLLLLGHIGGFINSAQTTRSIHSCISYFVDNGIAFTEESFELYSFFFVSFQQHFVWIYQNFRADRIFVTHQIFNKLISSELYLLLYVMRVDEVIIWAISSELNTVFYLRKQHICRRLNTPLSERFRERERERERKRKRKSERKEKDQDRTKEQKKDREGARRRGRERKRKEREREWEKREKEREKEKTTKIELKS